MMENYAAAAAGGVAGAAGGAAGAAGDAGVLPGAVATGDVVDGVDVPLGTAAGTGTGALRFDPPAACFTDSHCESTALLPASNGRITTSINRIAPCPARS